MKSAPHYLLLTGSSQSDSPNTSNSTLSPTEPLTYQQGPAPTGGRWHFVLEPINHGSRIEADEMEPGVVGERLNLLAVVRGIEALEEPSKVTLITPSKFVGRGMRSGIQSWRENNWHWERFGEMKPIKHADLWQRIDRAMSYHKIDCRVWAVSQARRNMMLNPPPQRAGNQRRPLNNLAGQESPFADSHHQAAENRANRRGPQQRKIVLTHERMSDHLANLDDIAELEQRHRKLFKATQKGWTRVTEIGESPTAADILPRTFGCTVN